MNMDLNTKFAAYKNELKKDTHILNISSSQNQPINVGNSIGVNWEEHMDQDQILMAYTTVRYDYFEIFNMEFVQGRPFSKEFTTDEKDACIINETALKLMNLESPIGKQVYFNHPAFEESLKNVKIVGVVKDHHFRSLHDQIGPFIYRMYQPYQSFVYVKLKPEFNYSTIEYIKHITKKFAPDYPLNFQFLDDSYNQLYNPELRMGKIFSAFAFLAIFVSCLGLFGLASFTVEQRTKEIGVRKVLGASVFSIVQLLSKEFTKWVLVANFIACLIAWYAMNQWLQDFAYRINVEIWSFILASAIALMIALCTVSFQAIKAAIANPVESLRYE